MVAQSPRLIVSLSPAALIGLDQIWDWNAQAYSPEHADHYIAFLTTETEKLADVYFLGKPVPSRPNLSYINICKRRGGNGHVAVYERVGQIVQILNYYHTAQDWQNKLKDEMP